MVELLAQQPLLLIFLVAATGHAAGRVKVAGTPLGIAAVLFAGLAYGGLDPGLRVPDIVYQLGLVFFVYAVGLASGPAFVAALRRDGVRIVGFSVAMISLGALEVVLLRHVLDLRPAVALGAFAGSLTNTPALAAILEAARGASDPAAMTDPVVGYSLTYPLGVFGCILAVQLYRRATRADLAAGASAGPGAAAAVLGNCTVKVTMSLPPGMDLEKLVRAYEWPVTFGRIRRGDRTIPAREDLVVEPGDLVTVVGPPDCFDDVIRVLGERSAERLELDRREVDHRRILVSSPEVAGRRLGDLQLAMRFGAVVSRLRRGDVDVVPDEDTVLELGDRVRVVAERSMMNAVTAFFGDSYRAVSEVDVLTFSLGIALGLAAGVVPVRLPGDFTIRLGLAGGPLLVALVLGVLHRTGPLLWTMPYGANLTLRQVGVILFLGGIGIRAGHEFLTTLAGGGALPVIVAGFAVTFTVSLAAVWIGHRRMGIPLAVVIGMLAGLQTQPAVLGFALEQTRDDRPNLGYAAVFPVAMCLKIIAGQCLVRVMT